MKLQIDEAYILDFLKKNKLATLSTVNKRGLPDAAPIYYLVENNFEIYFTTPVHSQKNINLDFQNEVVLSITDEKTLETLMFSGEAFEAKDKLLVTLNKLAEKLNGPSDFVTILPVLKHVDQEKTAIVIKPFKIRLRRYNEDGFEEKILEFK